MHASVAMRMKLAVTASALGLIAVVGMSSMRTPLTSLKKLRELQLDQIRGTYVLHMCIGQELVSYPMIMVVGTTTELH